MQFKFYEVGFLAFTIKELCPALQEAEVTSYKKI
jgi:hypothetical protein